MRTPGSPSRWSYFRHLMWHLDLVAVSIVLSPMVFFAAWDHKFWLALTFLLTLPVAALSSHMRSCSTENEQVEP